MNTVKNLIDEYVQKFAEASAQKQYKKVIALNKEFGERIHALPEPINEIAAELATIAKNPCQEKATLWLTAAQLHPSLDYLDALCAILEQEKECVWHEGVIYILHDLADARAIPYLDKAIKHKLNYDTSRQVATRAFEALAKIGTPEALDIIKSYLTSNDAKLQEEARLMLEDIQG